ncbi:MAG TPA: winged helix-turn-helix transcriptional regulator [Armatimonadetes bacterium]|nr:winged helix-turn-helix transcriptional regulator [Armatimonadota bacterium]
MKGLSPKQKQVLEILEDAVREGQHLTVREIGDRIGVSSTCTVHQHLKALERKGYLKPANHRHRSIQLTSPPRPFVPVPVGGNAVAGEAQGQGEPLPETMLIPTEWVGQDESVLFRVVGNGLADAAIRDGDLVLVTRGREPSSGDVVVTQKGEQAELSWVTAENGCLCVRNGGTTAIPLTQESELTVLGRVSVVIRRL